MKGRITNKNKVAMVCLFVLFGLPSEVVDGDGSGCFDSCQLVLASRMG